MAGSGPAMTNKWTLRIRTSFFWRGYPRTIMRQASPAKPFAKPGARCCGRGGVGAVVFKFRHIPSRSLSCSAEGHSPRRTTVNGDSRRHIQRMQIAWDLCMLRMANDVNHLGSIAIQECSNAIENSTGSSAFRTHDVDDSSRQFCRPCKNSQILCTGRNLHEPQRDER